MPDDADRASTVWPWTLEVRRILACATLGGGLALLGIGQDGEPSDHLPPPTLIVDLNAAPAELLSALPGIGPKLAARVVEARREGAFASLDDFDRRVKGIGPATMARLAPHLRIDPPRGKADPQVVRAKLD